MEAVQTLVSGDTPVTAVEYDGYWLDISQG
jgi:hypothetical protein